MYGRCERRRGVNVPEALGLSEWKMALPSKKVGKAMRGTGLGSKSRNLILAMLGLDVRSQQNEIQIASWTWYPEILERREKIGSCQNIDIFRQKSIAQRRVKETID